MRDFPDDEVITAVGASSGLRGFPFDESLYLKPRFAPFFDGLAQYVQLSEAIVIPPNVDFYIEAEVSGIPADAYYSVFSGPTISDFYRTRPNNDGIQTSLSGTYGLNWTSANSDSSARHKYGLSRVGNLYSIIVDDVLRSTRTTDIGAIEIDRLMRMWTLNTHTSGVVYSFKVWLNDSLSLLIEFNQKNQAVQVPSVGSISAMITNHTDAMWRNV
ncbi:hypothetical protein [Vibrio anguillarum]|uniref:hypothetical protein n=1 Tax=Vibrio anguillarum TaxID=55601 RepID=UPI0011DE9787|nr:hypothetical protein [Vibrio anguillarum]TYC93835.1 hypothetical protein FXB64_05440 [Vibrio anguillarum]TYC97388.1 hypothetical protein FXB62_04015 [Vibrio anguillarum]